MFDPLFLYEFMYIHVHTNQYFCKKSINLKVFRTLKIMLVTRQQQLFDRVVNLGSTFGVQVFDEYHS